MDESSRIAALELENARLKRQVETLSGATASSVEERLEKLLGDRVVLANLPDFISILERDTRVVYLNRTVPGRRVEEMIGTLSTDHLVGEHSTRFVEAFESAWNDAELRTLEFSTVSDYHFISRFVPILDRGTTAFVLVTTTDVTERRRTEIALRESESRLRQAQKMDAVGRLTAGIAHNFNNTLGIILPNVDLARVSSGPRLAERLDAIEHAAKGASEMVRDLMFFARGSGPTRRRPEDVVALANRTLAIARSAFGPTVFVELTAERSLPAVVVDAGQLEQVLLNVCLNARDALVDAATPDPRITVHVARASSQTLTLRVADNGPGMDEATRSRVFEPFFTTKPIHRGTGLGLSTAYAIVVDHGGRILCEANEVGGTTITIELPVTDEPAAVSDGSSMPVATSGSESILLVDDEPAIREVVRKILERAGFRVAEAADGIEGLARLDEASEPFDLVVVDGTMPRLGGAGFIAELARRERRPRVILLTGNLDVEIEGADAVIEKPVSMPQLLATVRCVLDRA